jgi:hypothetical protein
MYPVVWSFLLAYRGVAWGDRATLGKGVAYVADDIAIVYTNLADYLTSEIAKH